eukprot:1152021-Pelagomonas_calceolata.AAC.4
MVDARKHPGLGLCQPCPSCNFEVHGVHRWYQPTLLMVRMFRFFMVRSTCNTRGAVTMTGCEAGLVHTKWERIEARLQTKGLSCSMARTHTHAHTRAHTPAHTHADALEHDAVQRHCIARLLHCEFVTVSSSAPAQYTPETPNAGPEQITSLTEERQQQSAVGLTHDTHRLTPC